MKPITIKATCIALLGAAVFVASGQDRTPENGAPPDEGDATRKKRTFGNGVLSQNVAIYDVDNSGGLSVEEYQALQTDRTR